MFFETILSSETVCYIHITCNKTRVISIICPHNGCDIAFQAGDRRLNAGKFACMSYSDKLLLMQGTAGVSPLIAIYSNRYVSQGMWLMGYAFEAVF